MPFLEKSTARLCPSDRILATTTGNIFQFKKKNVAIWVYAQRNFDYLCRPQTKDNGESLIRGPDLGKFERFLFRPIRHWPASITSMAVVSFDAKNVPCRVAFYTGAGKSRRQKIQCPSANVAKPPSNRPATSDSPPSAKSPFLFSK